MTPAKLRDYTRRDLAQMAKHEQVPGWHAMRKDELIAALTKKGKRKTPSKSATNGELQEPFHGRRRRNAQGQ
jgi:hypothetical protein